MYTEAVSELLNYAAGSAIASGLERVMRPEDPDPRAGVVERARAEREREGTIGLTVSSVVALVLVLALFRGR